jgi:1A family penicillin-binding protein
MGMAGTFIVLASLGAGAISGLLASFSQLPGVESLKHYVPVETSKIYDCKGRLIANVHGEENRVVIPLRDIPMALQHAVIAMEDTDFYHHFGINPKGITRAALVNVAEGGRVEGASTLTQQLAKNLFLDPSRTMKRKLAEAWLAIQIERHYSKSTILEMYLNQVYWGHNAYGVEAAAQNYFGQSCRELSLAQSAVLAGILRGPELYSPYRNPQGARQLQRLVLQRMLVSGFINNNQYRLALKEPLRHPGVSSYSYKVPWFTATVIRQLTEEYGAELLQKGGLRIQSTLDLDLQLKAEAMLNEAVKRNKPYNIHQAALVAIEPRIGYVRALVGGCDFNKSKFNRATQALRPPGSTFKPFVYLTALSAGFKPGTVMVDEPISIPTQVGEYYSPNNYDNRFRGPITLQRALESSINVIAVKLGVAVGLPAVIKTAHALGVRSDLGENLSLPLGTSEVTPFEMTAAYATLANDGLRVAPVLVSRILDRNGQVLLDAKPKAQRVCDKDAVRHVVRMMEGVIQRGTGTAAGIGRPAAGKTGTTSDARDVWFVGFTPDLATGVWMGNDDNSKLNYSSTGGTLCAPLWSRFMRYALRNTKATGFPTPGRLKGQLSENAIQALESTKTASPATNDEAPMESVSPAPTDKLGKVVRDRPNRSAPARRTPRPVPAMRARPERPARETMPKPEEADLEPIPLDEDDGTF